MKARRPLLLALALFAPTALAAHAQNPSAAPGAWDTPSSTAELPPLFTLPGGNRAVRGELVIGLDDWGARDAVRELVAGLGGRVLGAIPRLAALRVALPDGADELELARLLHGFPSISYAEPNGIGEGGGTAPNDSHFSRQWHHRNTGQIVGTVGTPGADIQSIEAWNIQRGSESVVVAVLDTGIDFSHPEFQNRTLPGFDFVNEDPDATADHPHGTHVTGLLAANADNAFGVAGVDHRCRILPVKVLNSGNFGTTFDLVQGLDFAAAAGADVISMSLINYVAGSNLLAALNGAAAAGSILIACGGNLGIGNADVSWPGAVDATIAIGWTDNDDVRHPNSGTGSALDFVAPGASVATVHQAHVNTFSFFVGCSAATPIAAGIASLLLAENPQLDQDQVYELLRMGAEDQLGDPNDAPGYDTFYGHGRLNAFGSLSALCACTTAQPLKGSPPAISLGDGGSHFFQLDAGVANAGRLYFLVGSAAGTIPGTPLGPLTLPLNVDAYLIETLTMPNMRPLARSFGVLDGDGRATALFSVPPGFDPALAGAQLNHAFAVLTLAPLGATFVSNPVALLLDT